MIAVQMWLGSGSEIFVTFVGWKIHGEMQGNVPLYETVVFPKTSG